MNDRSNTFLIILGIVISILLALLLFSNDWTFNRYNAVLEKIEQLSAKTEQSALHLQKENGELKVQLAKLEKSIREHPVVIAIESETPDLTSKGGWAVDYPVFEDYDLVRKALPKGGELRVPQLSDPENLNPIVSNDAGAANILGKILNSLTSNDPETLEIIPELAVSWVIGTDKQTVFFKLREGIKWSDGEIFDADDVLFTFKLVKNTRVNAPPIQSYFSDFDRVERLGKYEVKFVWKQKYFRMLNTVGGFSILPSHYYRLKYGIDDETSDLFADAFNKDNSPPAVTTGNYLFAEWLTGSKVTINRNPDSWQKGLGNFDRVVYMTVNDETAQLQKLKNGELDTKSFTVQQYMDNKDNEIIKENFNIHRYLSPGYVYFGYNMRRKKFADRRVRTALTHLMDREAVVKEVLFGFGKVITGPFFIGTPFNDEKIKPLSFSREKANALLAAAGWKDRNNEGVLRDEAGKKLEIKLFTNKGNVERETAAKVFIEALKNSGIDASYQYVDWAVLIEKLRKRDYDVVCLGWGMSLFDPDPFQLWHSSQAKEEGSNHVGFMKDDVDQLIEENRITFDRKKRIELGHRIHAIMHQEQPYTFLWSKYTFMALSKKIKNQKVYPGGLSSLEWHY